ncbi:MAG: hypothetical protein V4467_04430 [Patescibacteria group bacterium]
MKKLPPLQSSTTPLGASRKFTKFVLTHGHARDVPEGKVLEEKPIPRMKTAVITTSWWAQHDILQPNTQVPGPILTAADVVRYHTGLDRFIPVVENKNSIRFSVSIKLMPKTTRVELQAAWDIGVRTAKIYPAGVTHSKDGWTSFKNDMYQPVGWALEIGFIVCIHGEEPGDHIDTYHRESYFMRNRFKPMATTDFPGGRFNVEHISLERTIDMVGEMPANVTGGLTIQHALATRNDLLEGKWRGQTGLDPRSHFRPPAQKSPDMRAVRFVMFNAHKPAYQKFHFGPDSAPHFDKLCICGCPGAHVAPTLGPVIVDLFDQYGQLDSPAFAAFTVENGARAFGIKVDLEQTFELERWEWEMPESYGGVLTFFGGKKISWRPTEPAALDPNLLLAA